MTLPRKLAQTAVQVVDHVRERLSGEGDPEFAGGDENACALRDFSGANSVWVGMVQGMAGAIAANPAAVAEQNARIAAGLRRQDPGLIDQLIEMYQHRLLRYLIFLTGRREQAEDLFQDVWMRVLERGNQYTGRARFDTWLFTIARNMVIDQARRKSCSSLDEMCDTTAEGARPFEVMSEGRSPLEEAQRGQVAVNVSKALTKLDSAHREVLVLRFHEELTLEEIAALTRAPLSTVKSRLYRGMMALKPRLAAAGFTGQETDL
jgi:RNA polymerase sigma-70 factor (ECF subfamily)